MLNEISTFENVHMLLVFGAGAIVLVAMVLGASARANKLKSDDQRLENLQKIELTYANQLKISDKGRKSAKNIYEND